MWSKCQGPTKLRPRAESEHGFPGESTPFHGFPGTPLHLTSALQEPPGKLDKTMGTVAKAITPGGSEATPDHHHRELQCSRTFNSEGRLRGRNEVRSTQKNRGAARLQASFKNNCFLRPGLPILGGMGERRSCFLRDLHLYRCARERGAKRCCAVWSLSTPLKVSVGCFHPSGSTRPQQPQKGQKIPPTEEGCACVSARACVAHSSGLRRREGGALLRLGA